MTPKILLGALVLALAFYSVQGDSLYGLLPSYDGIGYTHVDVVMFLGETGGYKHIARPLSLTGEVDLVDVIAAFDQNTKVYYFATNFGVLYKEIYRVNVTTGEVLFPLNVGNARWIVSLSAVSSHLIVIYDGIISRTIVARSEDGTVRTLQTVPSNYGTPFGVTDYYGNQYWLVAKNTNTGRWFVEYWYVTPSTIYLGGNAIIQGCSDLVPLALFDGTFETFGPAKSATNETYWVMKIDENTYQCKNEPLKIGGDKVVAWAEYNEGNADIVYWTAPERIHAYNILTHTYSTPFETKNSVQPVSIVWNHSA